MNQSRLKLNFPKCQICTKPFDMYYHMPRVIPKCGHTFCEKCIKLKSIQKGTRSIFQCPDCEVQVVIRKTIADELPRNITILELVKHKKMGENQQEPQMQVSSHICKIHNKKIDMVCLTCNSSKICSHCALFGSHKGHHIGSEDSANKDDLKQLRQFISIIEDTIQTMVTPNSPQNIEMKAKNELANGLKMEIRQNFSRYYEEVKKRQNQLLTQCQNIELSGHTGDFIDQILDDFDKIKIRSVEISQGASRSQVDQLFQQAKTLHHSIDKLIESYNSSVQMFVTKAKTKINEVMFLRVQNADSRSINAILNDNDNHNSQLKKQSSTLPIHKSKPPQQRTSAIKNIKDNIQAKTTEFDTKQEVKTSRITQRNTATAGGNRQKNNKYYSHIDDNEDLQLNLKQKRTGTNSKSKFREGPKSQRSPIKDLKVGDLHYVAPTKQVNYQLRPRLQNIYNEIERQQVQGTLQLIGMDIKDNMIGHICEFLRSKRLKYSMIKLVKNGLTDEGLRILLSYLATDDFTKVLNVTSNHLTNRSLKTLEQFISLNNILKTIYVSNNKMNPIQVKKLQPVFESKFVQVIL